MNKTKLSVLILLLICCWAVVAQEKPPVRITYEEYKAKLKDIDDNEARIKLSTEYARLNNKTVWGVRAFPDIVSSVVAADGNSDRAIDLINQLLSEFEYFNAKDAATYTLLEAYGKSTRSSEIIGFARDYLAGLEESQRFSYLPSVAKRVVEAKEVEYALSLYEEAIAYYKKVMETSEGKEKESAQSRIRGVQGSYAYALYKDGQLKESLAAYEKAAKNSGKDVLEMPQIRSMFHDEPLHHWGIVLAENGDIDAGMEKIAYPATIKNNKAARDDLLKLYVKKNGSDDHFAQYMQKMHDNFSKPVPDFTLKDLAGNDISSQTFKDRVTLIYIWSNT